MKRRSLAGLAAAVAVALAGWVPASGKGSRSGVYSETQANEGAQVYAMQCAMCHGTRLEGTVETPGLVGKFVANWAGRPLGDLFDYLARAMPQGSPGKLSPQDNARLVAFILSANGAPPGPLPLPADAAALRRISFDPAGPESCAPLHSVHSAAQHSRTLAGLQVRKAGNVRSRTTPPVSI